MVARIDFHRMATFASAREGGCKDVERRGVQHGDVTCKDDATRVLHSHDLYVCVCVCVCARARAYVRACVRACVRARVIVDRGGVGFSARPVQEMRGEGRETGFVGVAVTRWGEAGAQPSH